MIQTPIVLSEAHIKVLEPFLALPKNQMRGEWWSCDAVTEVKSTIKSFYIAAQGRRCCYCNRQQDTLHHRAWDIDHIVPRSTHPQFMFATKNLAVTCLDCNVAKTNKQVLRNPKRKTYPRKSQDFLILHPHFDQFAEHIFNFGYVYLPKTAKGKFTIVCCNLLRYAVDFVEWKSDLTDSRFEQEVTDALAEVSI